MEKKKIIIVLIFLIFVLIVFFYYLDADRNKNNLNMPKDKISENKVDNFEQLRVIDFKNEIVRGDTILIDVRTPEELPIYGKISEKQILIDINGESFSEKIMRLNKSKKYLIYCWHGNRSAVVRDFMEEHGFTYAKDLQGGIDAWVREGEEIIK